MYGSLACGSNTQFHSKKRILLIYGCSFTPTYYSFLRAYELRTYTCDQREPQSILEVFQLYPMSPKKASSSIARAELPRAILCTWRTALS